MQQNSYLWRLTSMRLGAVIGLMFLFGLGYSQVPETNLTFDFGNHWIFGKNVYLEFNKDSIIQRKISGVDWIEGGTSISTDSSFYYFKGSFQYGKIQSANFELLPHPYYGFMSSTQGELLIKHFESPIHYNMVSSADKFEGYSFYSSFIDSTFVEQFVRFPFHGGEKQQAVNHQNGRDIWYANHAQTGDSIYFFLIKKEGMVECPVVTHTGNSYENDAATQGQMKFSSDGKYLAEASWILPYSIGLYHFNCEYPETDSIYVLKMENEPDYSKRFFYGLEFSPDSKKLYFTEGRKFTGLPPVTLNQFDLSQLNGDSIYHSWHNLDTLFNLDIGVLQLAPNGKIYLAIPNQKYLGVINDPNELGTACNYERQGLTLDSGGTCLYGLPTFNQSYFYTPQIDFRYEENCFTNQYEFWGADTFGAINFSWKFKDVRNETVEIRLGKNISYSFPNAESLENKYEVTFLASNGTKTDSVTKTLTIRPKMRTDFLGRDTFYCQGDTAFSISLHTPPNLHCIHWNGLEPYSNLMGDTVIGYENFYGYIPENTSRIIDTAGIYTARITNKSFCQVTDTIVVTEKPRPSKGGLSRLGNLLSCDVVASKYRWYYNGALQQTTDSNFLDPNQNGNWQVQLVSEFGCESELSDSMLVDFASTKNYELKTINFTVYPNPSSGLLTIELAQKNSDIKIEVLDLNGKVVHRQHSKNSEFIMLNLELAAGSYTLQITYKNGNVGAKKVVVE
jgi:hypothetical protein